MATTVGIDLASQPENTAICSIDWSSGRVAVWGERDGPSPEEAMRDADWTGIDAPFGWPVDFTAALVAFERDGTWPETPSGHLRHRLTDRHVRATGGPSPLSVSSDRIGVCAWRCARMLACHAHTTKWTFKRVRAPRDRGGVVEVYPAAALRRWQIARKGYKGDDPRPRELIAEDLCASHLDLTGVRDEIVENHDKLDALVCALIARAVAQGEAEPPRRDATTQREGWIELPKPDSLARLLG